MATLSPHLQAAAAAVLLSSPVMGQTAFPDHVVQDETWADGVHQVAVTQKILSPGDVHEPMAITGTADAEFVSGTSIRLAPGFHAGAFSGNGTFHAHIDPGLGPDGDVVLVAPDPATAVIGNVLRVPKWEKLEIGLRLPEGYRAAIDSFFVHYYGDTNNTYVATPGNVDPAHDLNPYADDSLQLVLTLTRPDGTQTLKWGFFMRESRWEGAGPDAHPIGNPDHPLDPYHIRFRLAPDQEGPWHFKIALKAPNTHLPNGDALVESLYTGYAFHCGPPLPDNHGPLRVNEANRRTLQFEDGTPYFGLGTNMETTGYGQDVPGCGVGQDNSWADPNSYRLVRYNYEMLSQAFAALSGVGGNFVRLFQMSRTFAPENVNLGVYDRFMEMVQCSSVPTACTPTVLGNVQANCQVFDQVLDLARQNGIYIQLCVVPYPPIISFENWGWRNDPYLSAFVEPRDTATGLYDMKRYFYSNGDTATANDPGSAFYYWKRKYKYVMSRWGWSVHIPIIEPFNEIDQMLTYYWRDLSPDANGKSTVCPENAHVWPADTALPATISQWVTDIAQFVRGNVDPNDPVNSPLGHGKKLFLMSYARSDPDMAGGSNYYAPFLNPAVDLIDAHRGMYWGEGEIANSFNEAQAFRNHFTGTTGGAAYEKPFHQGESNYYQIKDYDGNHPGYDCAMIFDNYDVSFHNELWAGTFFGNFATMSTWHKERVFWWLRDIEKNRPPLDNNNPYYDQYPRSAALGATNALVFGTDFPPPKILVQNRTLYHHFKPLSEFLNTVALGPGGFFDQDHEARKVYDDNGKLECYYLLNADQTMAIGWVHNLNAYWENHYYILNQKQNYLGCASPGPQPIALDGFLPGLDYQVTWYPTRMNMTALPADQNDTTQSGTVSLDLSSLPFNGIYSWPANDNLDTLRSDYAFVIHALPVHRMVPVIGSDTIVDPHSWDFGMFPNPATDELNILLSDGPPVNLSLVDVAGRQVLHVDGLSEGLHRLGLKNIAPGAYSVRATAGHTVRTKLIIKR
ncbi:MAG: T9SS type A sorting domain-containing protein [Flavobacteriales bacterium]|nr:T9SS type A sorting domain-containing protein [Flavobacteriales bacterium]MEB2341476.1 T9SS type A sorting domain-containing protein [Flavobacteriia bacterium]